MWKAWSAVNQFGTLRIGEAARPGPPYCGFDDPEGEGMETEADVESGWDNQFGTMRIGEAALPGPQHLGFDDPEGEGMVTEEEAEDV